jgi:integrase
MAGGHQIEKVGGIISRWSERAGIVPKVNPKTPRKTIESWMLKAGIPEIEIYSRTGHDPLTFLMHYQSLSFTDWVFLHNPPKRIIKE